MIVSGHLSRQEACSCQRKTGKEGSRNLPPFGSAAVIVEKQDCYLVVELPGGRVVFPGGFLLK